MRTLCGSACSSTMAETCLALVCPSHPPDLDEALENIVLIEIRRRGSLTSVE